MGRSEGKNRLREVLLGGGSANLKTSNRAVIKGELKKRLEKKLLIFKKRNFFSRQKFYQDIITELAECNKEGLLNDPTFLAILDQENRFLKRDIDLSLDEESLNQLAPIFIDSLSTSAEPHLGRDFLKSDQVNQKDKQQLLDSYFKKLAKKESDQESLYSFALNNVWPLTKNNPQFADQIIKKLAEPIANPGSCHAQKVISDLSIQEALFHKDLERRHLAKRLTIFFQGDRCTHQGLEDCLSNSKKEAALTSVVIKAALGQDDFTKSKATEIADAPRLLTKISETLKGKGIKEPDQGIYFSENLYNIFGGQKPDAVRAIIKNRPLDLSESYLILKRVIDSGSIKPNSFYNYRSVFLEELDEAF
jgi:hypothetical protein